MNYLIFDLESCYCDGFCTRLEDSKRMLKHHKKERPYSVLIKGNKELADILNTFRYWIGYDSGTINNNLKNKMRLIAFSNVVEV